MKIYIITQSSEYGDEFKVVRGYRTIKSAQQYLLTHTDMEMHECEYIEETPSYALPPYAGR